MSEAIAIQSKDTKENALTQCCGRLYRHTWQMNAAGYLLRKLVDEREEDDQMDYAALVVCNGMLAASSLMMTDLDELYDLLDLPLPDWNEIIQNQPSEMDLVDAIKDAEKLAQSQKD